MKSSRRAAIITVVIIAVVMFASILAVSFGAGQLTKGALAQPSPVMSEQTPTPASSNTDDHKVEKGVSPAVVLPAPGQKLMPYIVTDAGAVDPKSATVQIASSKDVALVEFTLADAAYKRYMVACEAMKVRDGLNACDSWLRLSDDQCGKLVTADIQKTIVSWTNGRQPATIYCQVIVRRMGMAN